MNKDENRRSDRNTNHRNRGRRAPTKSSGKPDLKTAQQINPAKTKKVGDKNGRDNNNRQSKNRNWKNKSQRNEGNKRSEKAPNPQVLKVCALSGTGEVGRNANFLELGNDIVMVDCGLAFPTVEHYGVDYIIPNVTYLKKKKKNIRGIVITHGHLDHIGSLPYILPELDFPTVYASKTANQIIFRRLAEFKMEKRVKLIDVDENSKIKLGAFKVSFIHVTHSIPGCHSIFIESPRGNVFVSGDYKIDEHPLIEDQTNYSALGSLKGRIDLALMESTRAHTPGLSKTEYDLQETISKVVAGAKGRRVIIASFASNISRMYIAGQIAKRTGRKVFVSGRSSLNMLEIAKKDGFLKGMTDLFLDASKVKNYKDDKVLFLCTGSQGERYGALNLLSLNKHKFFRLKKGDLIIRSSSDIPGNDLEIEQMTSRLVSLGADLVNNKVIEVHYGGHGSIGDMQKMYELTRPKNVMPVHGHRTLRYYNRLNHLDWGMKDNNILMTDDGLVWSTRDGKVWKQKQHVDAKPVLVDGLGVGDIGDAVLKDREQLSEFGMVIVVLNLSSRKKELIGKPKFVSRGFVYVRTSGELFKELEKLVVKEHKSWMEAGKKSGKLEYNKLKGNIESKLGKLIHKKTERSPMILTQIV